MTETSLMYPAIVSLEPEGKQKTGQLDAAILEAIDASLSSFGDSVREAVYLQLEKNFQLKQSDIPSNIEEFVTTLEGIFGVGAPLIELKILGTLYARTKGFVYLPKGGDLVFKEYVQSLRSQMSASVSV